MSIEEATNTVCNFTSEMALVHNGKLIECSDCGFKFDFDLNEDGLYECIACELDNLKTDMYLNKNN